MGEKRIHWKRKPRVIPYKEVNQLTPEEQECVRIAVKVLRLRYGGTPKLARAMGVGTSAIYAPLEARGRPSAGLALRAARLAGVSVEAILSGDWPPDGACPLCGRVASES